MIRFTGGLGNEEQASSQVTSDSEVQNRQESQSEELSPEHQALLQV
jgi:hypothetical protein